MTRILISSLITITAAMPSQLQWLSVAAAAAPQSSPPETNPSPVPSPTPPRSLDELLGVPKAPDDRSAVDAAEREQKKRLERSLDEASLEDLVQRALEGMKTASGRLTDEKDPGLGTQRVQEEVVKTLDRLLEEAQKQQKKSSGSSSKSTKSKKDQKSGDPSEQNGQQRGKKSPQQATSASSSSQSESSSDGESSQERSADEASSIGAELTEARIEWGQLPERVRELVLQGRRDKVSTLYERLTREYYKRLAEEASK